MRIIVATVATLLQQLFSFLTKNENAMALLQHCRNNVATVATVATIVATVATQVPWRHGKCHGTVTTLLQQCCNSCNSCNIVETMLQQCHGIGVVGDDYEDSKVDSVPWQKILIFG